MGTVPCKMWGLDSYIPISFLQGVLCILDHEHLNHSKCLGEFMYGEVCADFGVIGHRHYKTRITEFIRKILGMLTTHPISYREYGRGGARVRRWPETT